MKNNLFHAGICILLLFSAFIFPVAETATAVSAAEEPERYMVALDTDHGTFIDYDESYDIYFQPGEPLKLPKVKKKGYVFCGWTAKPLSNMAWFTITGESPENPWGCTYAWHEPKKLYAQFAKVTMKKLGKRKLKVSLSKWADAGKLEIQYSTNKKFKNAKSFVVTTLEYGPDGPIDAPIDKKNCTFKFSRKTKTLSLTLNKLKAKKKYYFRFQFLAGIRLTEGYMAMIGGDNEYAVVIGDWFQKSVKM